MANTGFNQAFGFSQSCGFGNGFSYTTGPTGPRGPVVHFDAGNPASYSGSGTSWIDLVGGKVATLTGGYLYDSKYGSIKFNGTTGYALTTDDIQVDLTDGFTMEFVVKFNSLSGEKPVMTFNDPGYMNAIVSGGDLRWEVDAGQAMLSVHPMVTNTWHHYVCTWKRLNGGTTGTAQIYEDGVILSTTTLSCNELSRTSSIELGRYEGDGVYLDGWLAIAKIYDRALEASEVASKYAEISDRFPASPLMLFLDAGNTASYPGYGAAWTDLSDYGHNFDLQYSPTYNASNEGTISFDSLQYQHAEGPPLDDTTDWTVEAWVKFDYLPYIGQNASVVTDMYDSVNVQYSLGTNAGAGDKIYAGFYDGAWHGSSFGLVPEVGKWYHLAQTYDGSDLKFYVTGTLMSSDYVGATSKSGATGTRIMRRWDDTLNSANFLSGTIGLVRVYKTALSASAVVDNYNEFKGRYELPGVVQDSLELWFDSRYAESYPGSGTSWTDLKNGVVATMDEGVTFQPVAKEMVFDGSAASIAQTGPYTADLSSGFSIEAYVKWSNLPSYDGVIAYNDSPRFINLEYYSPGVRFEGAGSQLNDGNTPTIGTYYHYVATYDGTYTRLYRDGSLVVGPTVVSQAQSASHTAPWVMGYWDGYFNGAIKTTRLYSKALSDAEVTQNYAATVAGP